MEELNNRNIRSFANRLANDIVKIAYAPRDAILAKIFKHWRDHKHNWADFEADYVTYKNGHRIYQKISKMSKEKNENF